MTILGKTLFSLMLLGAGFLIASHFGPPDGADEWAEKLSTSFTAAEPADPWGELRPPDPMLAGGDRWAHFSRSEVDRLGLATPTAKNVASTEPTPIDDAQEPAWLWTDANDDTRPPAMEIVANKPSPELEQFSWMARSTSEHAARTQPVRDAAIRQAAAEANLTGDRYTASYPPAQTTSPQASDGPAHAWQAQPLPPLDWPRMEQTPTQPSQSIRPQPIPRQPAAPQVNASDNWRRPAPPPGAWEAAAASPPPAISNQAAPSQRAAISQQAVAAPAFQDPKAEYAARTSSPPPAPQPTPPTQSWSTQPQWRPPAQRVAMSRTAGIDDYGAEHETPRTHIVADGDTLAGIAARYLGDASQAERLYQWNAAVLRDPMLLPIGAELQIAPPMASDYQPVGVSASPTPRSQPPAAVPRAQLMAPQRASVAGY